MKKALLAVLAVLVFCSAGMAAIKDSPAGFRGVKWGQPPSALGESTVLLIDGATSAYSKNGDKLKIGDTDLTYIIYVFWENKFMMAIIQTEGLNNGDALRAALLARYGEPRQKLGVLKSDYAWGDENAMITYTYDTGESKSRVAIASTPIFNAKRERDEAAAQKGSKDF